MLADGVDTFIEMSPHPTLLGSVEVGQSRGAEPLALHSLRRQEPERLALLATFGALFAAGRRVDWRRLFGDDYARVDLPRYPWQRERYWLELNEPRSARQRRRRPDWSAYDVVDRCRYAFLGYRDWRCGRQPYLAEHVVTE